MNTTLDYVVDGLPALPDLSGYLTHYAAHSPSRLAMSNEREGLTYESADQQLARYAAALERLELGDGAVVAVFGNPRFECLLLFLACCKVGAIFLGLNPKYTPRELNLVCEDSRPRALFVIVDPDDTDHVAKAQALSSSVCSLKHVVLRSSLSAVKGIGLDDLRDTAEPAGNAARASDPHAPCALVYTSGSTGSPKGALLSQAGLLRSAALTWRYWYGGLRDIRTVVQHPINHVAWLTCECCAPMIAGATLFFRERFDGRRTLELVEQERLNLWFTFPAMVALAMKSPAFQRADLSSLKRVAFGSSPSRRIVEALRQRTRAVISTSYGLTEASGGAVTATDERDDPGLVASSVGRVVPGVEVRLLDDDGAEAMPGEPGELLIRDPCVFLGYLNRPADTEVAVDEDGWLHTADIATRDVSGIVRLIGRRREMFKSGGYNVYPAEVEHVLCDCPGVSGAAVVDVPDPMWGQVGVGFVTVDDRAELDLTALEAVLRQRLANYKIPKRFVIRCALPQLANGKVDKQALRAQASDAVMTASADGELS